MENKQDFYYIYKCRLCGKLVKNISFYTTRTWAVTRLLTILRDGSYTSGSTVTLTDIHSCANGMIGITDLQGISPVDTNDSMLSPHDT